MARPPYIGFLRYSCTGRSGCVTTTLTNSQPSRPSCVSFSCTASRLAPKKPFTSTTRSLQRSLTIIVLLRRRRRAGREPACLPQCIAQHVLDLRVERSQFVVGPSLRGAQHI